jgi:uncharacterized repeat protein (TIGR01451 family)
VALVLALSSAAHAAAPGATLGVDFAPGSPNPPLLNQTFTHELAVANTGDVPLDNLVVIDTLPVEMTLDSVRTGSYTGLTDFAAGEGVRVSYEKNTAPGVFTLWGSSPNTTFQTTLTSPPPGLGQGEYLTRVRWEFGQAAPGMQATSRPALRGRATNPDNAGGPVAVGDTVQNCAALTAQYTAGPTTVTSSACKNFQLVAGPTITTESPDSVALGSSTRATATLRGGNPTGVITFQVFGAGDSTCAIPLFGDDVAVNGANTYNGPDFTSTAAGGYKWVARYSGDNLHAAAATACNDPAGAFAAVAPPVASAAFGAAAIDVGASTPLTFTIENPAANTVPLTGVALSDTLPAGLFIATPNGVSGTCGGGTVTALEGSANISLVGGIIPVGSSCTFSVDVTGANVPGPVATTTGAVSSANGGTGNTAAASLTIRAPTATTLACDSEVTLGEDALCTATVDSATAPEGTVAFASDGAGLFSPETCTLEPASGSARTCAVHYTPEGDVPAAGRSDTITADYAPANADTWTPSVADASLPVRERPAPPTEPTPTPTASPTAPPAPATPAAASGPRTAQALALACSPADLVLLSAAQAGRRVRFRGAASTADAGKQVTIRTLNGRRVARATVRPDGSFAASGRRPSALSKTRYYAQLGERRSGTLKLTRRLTADITASASTITIRGRVTPPLGRPIRRVVITRLTSCGTPSAVVARVKPNERGRFRAAVAREPGPALYRIKTRVSYRSGRPGALPTFALLLGVDAAR